MANWIACFDHYSNTRVCCVLARLDKQLVERMETWFTFFRHLAAKHQQVLAFLNFVESFVIEVDSYS